MCRLQGLRRAFGLEERLRQMLMPSLPAAWLTAWASTAGKFRVIYALIKLESRGLEV